MIPTDKTLRTTKKTTVPLQTSNQDLVRRLEENQTNKQVLDLLGAAEHEWLEDELEAAQLLLVHPHLALLLTKKR